MNKELEEKISKHFNMSFVYSPKLKMFVVKNGVWFSKQELEEHRKEESWLTEEFNKRSMSVSFPLCDYDLMKRKEIFRKLPRVTERKQSQNKPVLFICIALGLVSVVSMYISTVHTATYLFDYVDMLSAWLMSAVITIYSSTAFEVIILFQEKKKYILSFIFALLWFFVTLFSMITTVSVFYDKFNFTTLENIKGNSSTDSYQEVMRILQKDESDIRESIRFKKEDIQYRRKMDYATHERTLELNELQTELKENLEKQAEILSKAPEVAKGKNNLPHKETLFAFLGRILGLEGGILEFIMSTLSAIFVNLISPLSLTVVVSFTEGGKKR